MHITTQGRRLHCVEWDVKLYYNIRYEGPADNNELKIEKITDVQFIQNQCNETKQLKRTNVMLLSIKKSI